MIKTCGASIKPHKTLNILYNSFLQCILRWNTNAFIYSPKYLISMIKDNFFFNLSFRFEYPLSPNSLSLCCSSNHLTVLITCIKEKKKRRRSNSCIDFFRSLPLYRKDEILNYEAKLSPPSSPTTGTKKVF